MDRRFTIYHLPFTIYHLLFIVFSSIMLTACWDADEAMDATPSDILLRTMVSEVVLDGTDTQAEIDVEANSLWTATTQADWLTLSPTHAEGSCRLTVTAAANDWIEKRETTIQLSSAKGVRRMITVQQLGGDIPIPDNADNERPQFARRKKP